jgi:acyl-CoA synthetase (AMP-forming)/AMP-acid ligase II
MTSVLNELGKIWGQVDQPFFVKGDESLSFSDVAAADRVDLSLVQPGNVVALVGDFDAVSVNTLLRLLDLRTVIVPLTKETEQQHESFFQSAMVDVVIAPDSVTRRSHKDSHPLLETLRSKGHSGLVLFSSGTTGEPKAILHDLSKFLERYRTPRPRLRTLGFLLFDHIGGINTLIHTLFNRGVVIIPENRSPKEVLKACALHDVEVLPTTPTFLRMMIMTGLIPKAVPKSLKIVTYGTEKMDQATLDSLCELLPNVDFRQTYGMSEIGILRVKSEARNSLFMRIGGEGVILKVDDGVLYIKSESRMLGYLNADSPFNEEGWYNTKDIVEQRGDFYSVVGRTSDLINFGGLKFMPSEVENVALAFSGIAMAKAFGRPNPFSGQHVELVVQEQNHGSVDLEALRDHLRNNLQRHMVPQRVSLGDIAVGHRFKKI